MKPDPYKGKIRCPRCGYPLLGLPPVHSCPECGLPYDPYSRMYRLRRKGLGGILMVLVPGVIIVLTGQLVQPGWLIALAPFFRYIPLVSKAGFVLFVVWFSIRYLKPASAILLFIDRSGIRLEQAGSAPVLLSWAEFGKACASVLYPSLHIKDRQGRRIAEFDGIAFGYLAVVCAERMNELAELYPQLELTPEEHTRPQPQK